MIRSIKAALLELPVARRLWASVRAAQYEKRYRCWQDSYSRLAEEKRLSYSREFTRQLLRNRLRNRNPPTRLPGEVNSLIMTLTSNWGIGLVYELAEFGPVTVIDWEKLGYDNSDGPLLDRVPELNARILEFVRQVHSVRALDWFLIAAPGSLILRDTLRAVHEDLGIPTVNQWLDCKQSFEVGAGPYGQDLGQKDVASEFDLVWTSSRSMCEPYLVVGARPLYLPEGFSPRLTPRIERSKRFDVGFLGACYGLRPLYIEAMRRSAIAVEPRGPGWDTGVLPLHEMGQFFSECKINLGFGGVGYSMQLTTLKGRDFEVPGAGGVYLTTYNPDLAEFFDIGKEILCYHSVQDMIDIVHRLLGDDARREDIAFKAYTRSMREHRWMHRFQVVLGLLGILVPSQSDTCNPISCGLDFGTLSL